MEMFIARYKNHFKSMDFLKSLIFAFFVLGLALVANHYAGQYAVEKASNSVTDIVLDNIRVYDVDDIFVYGPVIMWFFIAGLMAFRPQRIPFLVKSTGLFYIIRSIFISLTHISPFPTHVTIISTGIFGYLNPGADLFFSGHTGFPFMLALMFWESKHLRIIFLAFSLMFAAVVLLGHLHYSIDVLSAFFISYGIYHIAGFIFPKDKMRWNSQ